MKNVHLIPVLLCCVVFTTADAQYGYSAGTGAVDDRTGVLNGFLENNQSIPAGTYYARGKLVYDNTNAYNTTVTIQPTSGSVRIIQGIGVESRDGRWKNRTQRASADAALGISDPFLTRFDDAAKNQVWIIDLAEQLGETDDRRNIPMF